MNNKITEILSTLDGNISRPKDIEERGVKGKWVWGTHPASRQRGESIKAHGGLKDR